MADVLIIMGSDSDLPVMAEAARVLEELEVSFDLAVAFGRSSCGGRI